MFGNPKENPNGYEIKNISDIFNVGSSKRVFESEWTESGVPFYRAREIVKLSKDGYVDNELFITEEMYENYKNKYGVPQEDDMMVTGVGTLGICYIVKKEDKFYFKDGNTLWFRNKGICNVRFIRDQYNTDFVREQIEANANTSTVGTYTITNANNTKVLVPPIDLQNKYVRFCELIDKSKFYNDEIKYNSLKMFFNLVDLLVEQTNNISIVYYAWKIINDIKLTENSKKLFFKLARYYIYHFPYLFPFFEKQIIEKLQLSNEEIKLIVNENLSVLIEKKNYEGISYCLYYVYKYKIEISSLSVTLDELYDFAVDSNDCIVLLIASLCVKNITKEYKKYKNFAREILKNDDISRYWLFCYEVLTQSDLKSEWKNMKKMEFHLLHFRCSNLI